MSTERLETLATPVLHVRTCHKLVTQVRVLLDHLYRQLLQASDIRRRKSVLGDDKSVPVVSFDFLFAEDCPRWSVHFTLRHHITQTRRNRVATRPGCLSAHAHPARGISALSQRPGPSRCWRRAPRQAQPATPPAPPCVPRRRSAFRP